MHCFSLPPLPPLPYLTSQKCQQPKLPDKADMGAKAAMEGSTVGAQKDAKGDTCPAVVVNACMAVEAVLDKVSFQQSSR